MPLMRTVEMPYSVLLLLTVNTGCYGESNITFNFSGILKMATFLFL